MHDDADRRVEPAAARRHKGAQEPAGVVVAEDLAAAAGDREIAVRLEGKVRR